MNSVLRLSAFSLFLYFSLLFTHGLKAQEAYEGKGENRLSVGWAYYGRGNGMAFMYDHGFTDLISAGAGVEFYYLEGEREVSFFGIVDFHLHELLNLPERLDIYPGAEIGSFEGDFELYGYAGVSFALTHHLGIFTELGNRGTFGVYWNF